MEKHINKERKIHIPVLKDEVLKYLDPKPNENFIDCTFGGGGHALAILEKNGPKGKVLGIEVDPDLYKKIKSIIKEKRLILINGSFTRLREIVKKKKFDLVSGVLFDLGMSSWHLEESGRGFTFQKDEPLLMRYDKQSKFTAMEILNKLSKVEIEKILREYGQEKFANKFAEEICKEREKNKIETTFQLVKIIEKVVPSWYKKRKIHFATKTCQALRIFVNNELENLKIGLNEALKILRKQGRIVVISFHSLEDRIVKNFFKKKEKENFLRILTKKPVTPSKEEIKKNFRSRSAKLRAAIKI